MSIFKIIKLLPSCLYFEFRKWNWFVIHVYFFFTCRISVACLIINYIKKSTPSNYCWVITYHAHVTGNFLLLYLLLTPVHKDTCIYGHYTNDLYFHMYIHVLWNTLLLHVFYDHCYIVYKFIIFFFLLRSNTWGALSTYRPARCCPTYSRWVSIGRPGIVDHLYTSGLTLTPHWGQNCCRTLIIVFLNVLSNFKDVIHLCIKSKAFVTRAIFCQQNLSNWGSFRE